jgi:glycosyltransferase EpsD
MKILFCASTAGHILNFHLPYIAHYREQGWQVHVLASGLSQCIDIHRSYDLRITKKILSMKNAQAISQMVRIFKTEQYDLISVHTALAAALCRVALKLSGAKDTKLAYTCHGYFFTVGARGRVSKTPKSLFYLTCEKLLANATDLLILMNQEDLGSAKRYKLADKIEFTLGMGVDPQQYPKLTDLQKAQEREAIGIAGEDVVFLCVGEFSKRKNQRQVLAAFAQLNRRLPNTVLIFAGGGELLPETKFMAKGLELDNRAIFCGHVGDMGRLYAISDVLVTASYSEGLPFCVMEALLSGLPVVASRIKGHTDLVQDGYNGMLYDAENTEQLESRMSRLAGDKECLGKLRTHATLPQQYRLDAVKPRMVAILNGAVPVCPSMGGIA